MAVGSVHNRAPVSSQEERKSYAVPLALVVALYFGIGFITAMNDVLVPHFKDLFHLSNVRALLVQFAFFGAYFLLSLPSGRIVSRIGYKAGIVVALAVMGLGLLLFLPASYLITYPLFLFALFVVGCGLALLQVAINPYVGALGSPETAASRLNLAGFFNSLAGTLAPHVGNLFIFVAAGAGTAALARSVRMPYATLAALAFLMAVLTRVVHLPTVLPENVEGSATLSGAWQFRHLRFGVLAIFMYVGAEVAIGSLLINYLGQPSMGGMSHHQAAYYVSLYWGGAMIGRLAGFFVLQRVRQAPALTFVAVLATLSITVAVLAHGPLALWALVSCGLFNSVMWPCIFPMSLEGLGRYTSRASGLLVTMVVGGAIIPELQGLLADRFGYQRSFLVVLVCYIYILFFALRGHRPATMQAGETLAPAVVV